MVEVGVEYGHHRDVFMAGRVVDCVDGNLVGAVWNRGLGFRMGGYFGFHGLRDLFPQIGVGQILPATERAIGVNEG